MNLNQFVKQQISSALPTSNSVNLVLGSDSDTLPTIIEELKINQRKHLTISNDIICRSQPHEVWTTVNRIKHSGRDVILIFNRLDQLELHESAIHQFQLITQHSTVNTSPPGAVFLLLANTNQTDLTPPVQRSVDTMFVDS